MSMPARQRGLSVPGFIFGAVIIVLVGTIGLKVIPVYVQNAEISNLFTTIANDAEMQKASIHDIRSTFGKRASINNITTITADDVEITNKNGRLELSASYAVKVPLVANASLYLEFNSTSAK